MRKTHLYLMIILSLLPACSSNGITPGSTTTKFSQTAQPIFEEADFLNVIRTGFEDAKVEVDIFHEDLFEYTEGCLDLNFLGTDRNHNGENPRSISSSFRISNLSDTQTDNDISENVLTAQKEDDIAEIKIYKNLFSYSDLITISLTYQKNCQGTTLLLAQTQLILEDEPIDTFAQQN